MIPPRVADLLKQGLQGKTAPSYGRSHKPMVTRVQERLQLCPPTMSAWLCHQARVTPLESRLGIPNSVALGDVIDLPSSWAHKAEHKTSHTLCKITEWLGSRCSKHEVTLWARRRDKAWVASGSVLDTCRVCSSSSRGCQLCSELNLAEPLGWGGGPPPAVREGASGGSRLFFKVVRQQGVMCEGPHSSLFKGFQQSWATADPLLFCLLSVLGCPLIWSRDTSKLPYP